MNVGWLGRTAVTLSSAAVAPARTPPVPTTRRRSSPLTSHTGAPSPRRAAPSAARRRGARRHASGTDALQPHIAAALTQRRAEPLTSVEQAGRCELDESRRSGTEAAEHVDEHVGGAEAVEDADLAAGTDRCHHE